MNIVVKTWAQELKRCFWDESMCTGNEATEMPMAQYVFGGCTAVIFLTITYFCDTVA